MRHETRHLVLQDLELRQGRRLHVIVQVLGRCRVGQVDVLAVTHIDIKLCTGSNTNTIRTAFLGNGGNQRTGFDGIDGRAILGTGRIGRQENGNVMEKVEKGGCIVDRYWQRQNMKCLSD